MQQQGVTEAAMNLLPKENAIEHRCVQLLLRMSTGKNIISHFTNKARRQKCRTEKPMFESGTMVQFVDGELLPTVV